MSVLDTEGSGGLKINNKTFLVKIKAEYLDRMELVAGTWLHIGWQLWKHLYKN